MSFKRNIYLKMKTLKEARDILFQTFSNLPSLPREEISVPDAVDRVLAKSVSARLSSPNFHLAAMDGLAVKACTIPIINAFVLATAPLLYFGISPKNSALNWTRSAI